MENQEVKELEKKLAGLEFVNDQLSAELEELNHLLMEVGFTYGLQTVKVVAAEMLAEKTECE